MSEFTPLKKEILNSYKNEDEVNVFQRRVQITAIIHEMYDKIIKLAIKGDTKYIFPLTGFCKNRNPRDILTNTSESEFRMKCINELISTIYSVLPDSNIQYNEKKIYDIQDRETIVPCIIIDWS
jgi:hypothetical protein